MTKKMLPSPAQMRVLEAMAGGASLDGYPGLDLGLFHPPTCCNMGPVKASTATAMLSAGWILRRGSFPSFALTALGRHALEAARASKGAE